MDAGKIMKKSSRTSSCDLGLVVEQQGHELSQRRERRVSNHQGTLGIVVKLERDCEHVFQHLDILLVLVVLLRKQKEIVTIEKEWKTL